MENLEDTSDDRVLKGVRKIFRRSLPGAADCEGGAKMLFRL